jgi:L-amino acid N-acyltransferase YncA
MTLAQRRPHAPAVEVRDATDADMDAVAAIYAHHVRTGLATFEETPPTSAEIAERRRTVLAQGLPYLVATLDKLVCGFAYAAPYRARSAYRYSVEDSIYVAPDKTGRGIGGALLAALIPRCAAAGKRQIVAVIGDSGNVASIGVHAKAGFRVAGVLPAVGYKLGRWVDSVIMVRPLGDGDRTPPAA